MAKGIKLKKNGETVYPKTLPELVIEPTSGISVQDAVFGSRFYGVERKRAVADPAFEPIGNPLMHRDLPLHNLIRICKVDENRRIMNYLDQTDITKNEDGSPSVLDGSDDQDVMVHYPKIYAILDGGGSEYEVWAISDAPFTYRGQNAILIKSFVDSADYCTFKDNKSRCVQSEDSAYAGSGSGATVGGIGYPRTVTSRYDYEIRATAKGDKWNAWLYMDYLVQQAFMYIEYKTRYLRSAEIFGNIGAGWTGAHWSAYNGYYPVIKILEAHLGISNTTETKAKGHLTGVYIRNFQFEIDGNTVEYNTPFGVYRGKILWGHLWKHISGVEVEVQSDEEGGKSNVYVQFDPNKIDANRTNDNFTFKDTYQLIGEAPRASGWGKESTPLSGIQSTIGGNVSTYMTGYWWAGIPGAGVSRRCLLFGAHLNFAHCAVGSALSHYAPSSTNAVFGGGFRAEADD